MWAGRTNGQKEKLIKDIAKSFEEIGVPKEHTTAIIQEIQKENWGMKGEQASKVK